MSAALIGNQFLSSFSLFIGKYDAVFDMLTEMNVPERSSAIYDWAIGGQIIYDFIWLRRNLDTGNRKENKFLRAR